MKAQRLLSHGKSLQSLELFSDCMPVRGHRVSVPLSTEMLLHIAENGRVAILQHALPERRTAS